jgi:hypothetical protein
MDSMQTKLLDKFDGVNAKVDGVEQRLDAKIDGVKQQLDAKIDDFKLQLDTKIDDVKSQLDAKLDKLGDSLTKVELRSYGVYAALAAAMLGTMARGFGWI